MHLKKLKSIIFIFSIILLVLGIIFYFNKIKQNELKVELGKVEVRNLIIGTGTSKGEIGTAIFGEIFNNGMRTIKIAVLNVSFLSGSGKILKEHKFYPVNKFSFSDSLALEPGQTKEFGFPIDDIVPEKWGGEISSRLIDLKFK